MRLKKTLHLLSLALVLSLLLVALPVSPALAASESIELQDSDGDEITEADIGDRVYVEGDDFEESDDDTDYYVDIYLSDEEAEEGDDINDDVENYAKVKSRWVDEDGEFETYFTVPDVLDDGDDDVDVISGTYYVYVTYDEDEEIVAMAEIEVTGAVIELDEDEAPVGTEVEITGADFNESSDITVEFDGEEIDIESGDDQTDSGGEFECTVIIPEAVAGEHAITVTDEDGSGASVDFTIEPEITFSPTSSIDPGDSITVTGTGFGKYVDVDILIDNIEVDTAETDTDGSFQISVIVPATLAAGSNYYLDAEDEDGNEVRTIIAIAAEATPTPTTQTSAPQPGGSNNQPGGTDPNQAPQEPAQTTATTSGSLWGLPAWVVYAGGALCLILVFLLGFMLAPRGRA